MGDDLVQRGGVHALAQSQRHGFGGRRNVHTSEQLVDDLDLAAGTRFVAELVDLGGHGVEQGFGHGIGGRGAGRHHGHLPAGGLGGTAGNRRIDVEQAHVVQALFHCHRPVGLDGGAHHKHAARLHGCGAALRAKQHALGLRGIDDH